MNGNSPVSSPASQQGVVLLESLIAILIFSMGILAVVGLQAAMIKNTSDAKYRAEASFIAQQQLGEMWADQGNLGSHAVSTAIPELLPNGTRTVTVTFLAEQAPLVSVLVTWQAPGQPSHQFITNARIDCISPLGPPTCFG